MTVVDAPILSDIALRVLEARYLRRDEQGRVIETPDGLFRRVATAIAQAERRYTSDLGAVVAWAGEFYRMLSRLEFLPNSPCLANAGKPQGQLCACFVLPVEDSLEAIFETVKHAALIHQSGGGTGYDFSRLRPAGSIVRSTAGIASGPVSFMDVFDVATNAIKQGGMRRGANMGVLRVDHPDIDVFVSAKQDLSRLTNFNVSVAVTDDFLAALDGRSPHADAYVAAGSPGDIPPERAFPLVFRDTVHRWVDAADLFDRIVRAAWATGDPGLLFVDRANASRANPVPRRGPLAATNPCGEQWLYAYDVCNLGSIDVSKFVVGGGLDWGRLRETVRLAVRFLDDVVDVTFYPLPEIAATARALRRVGLGVMGWADLLYRLRIPYTSDRALALAEELMAFITTEARLASQALARERGTFPEWEESIYGPTAETPYRNIKLRNAALTTVAPTGTISIIAGCSSGIEPVFALAFTRAHRLDRTRDAAVPLLDVNPVFRAVAEREGFASDDLFRFLANGGRLNDRPEVPDWVKQVFVTAHDVPPEWHVRMQAAFQKHVDNSISKTVNLPHDATPDDVAIVYRLAAQLGCLGVTVYRDGSRAGQVLSTGATGAEGLVADPTSTPSTSAPTPAPAAPAASAAVAPTPAAPRRRRLPSERPAITHRFQVDEQEGYLTVGLYDDGRPGEIFLRLAKQGSTLGGLLESLCQVVSLALQYGVPLSAITQKWRGSRYEPSGRTDNPRVPMATSIVDYLARYLDDRFPDAPTTPTAPATHDGIGDGNGDRPSERVAVVAGVTTVTEVTVVTDDKRPARGGDVCPVCGMAAVVWGEGCRTCHACGDSRCG
jgi:ribonucleoside-diphosphate reductase alpha chain